MDKDQKGQFPQKDWSRLPEQDAGPPNGGFILVCSLRNKYGHQFGSPAGVYIDVEGNILVADEQCHTVHLFPENGAPFCLVSADLKKPTDVACSFFGQLFVADTGENCLKPLRIVRPPYGPGNL
uniref:NHL repeat-containing protein 2 n=1 Tax=Apteryx owenii TaxID=8824 RepID=A0A8B9Q4W2_APTOW